jgi:2-oxoglutarate ferredoxin oxidoreductase subunit alpha
MQGNEACAAGALYAGLDFFAGYPITPSTEIAEILACELPKTGGRFIQMEDEIASIGACIGASLTGAKALTATSGPGFSLMQENLGFAIMTETPCVVVNVQRLGPSTGGPTAPSQGDVMQARWGRHGDQEMIVLTPASVEETFTLTVKAFNISEYLRTPVILLMDEIIAHMREGADLPAPGELEVISRDMADMKATDYRPFRPGLNLVPRPAPFGAGHRYHVTGLYHDESGMPAAQPATIENLALRLRDKITKNKDAFVYYEAYRTDDAETIIVSYGGSARSARTAVDEARKVNIKAGMLRLVTLWPFPDQIISQVCQNAKTVITAEMNLGQIACEVSRALHGKCRFKAVTHVDGTLIPPQKILSAIREAEHE